MSFFTARLIISSVPLDLKSQKAIKCVPILAISPLRIIPAALGAAAQSAGYSSQSNPLDFAQSIEIESGPVASPETITQFSLLRLRR